MMRTKTRAGVIAVVLAVALGASVFVLLQTFIQAIPLLPEAPIANLVLFICWILLSGFVLSIIGYWIYQQVALGQSDRPRILAALALALPVLDYGGDTFTVLPYVLNVHLDLGQFSLGLNTVAAGLLILVHYGVKETEAVIGREELPSVSIQ
jgi:hypothetical protein